MSKENLQNLTEIEQEFIQEDKGEGSLMVYAVRDLNADFSKFAERDVSFGLGYDITPLDVEALYFEGIKLPRWESIQAASVEEQMAIYNESFDKIKAAFPLISRVSDTDVTVKYTLEEVAKLQSECEQVAEGTDDAKAIKAAQKFYIACNRALENQFGIMLMPN